MKTEPAAKTWGGDTIGLLLVCAFHVVNDLVVISRVWWLTEEQLLIAMTLPLSQCSLAAIWASCSRANSYLRFAVPLIATVGCWFLFARVIVGGIERSATAGWAVVFTIQTLAIVLAILLYQLAWYQRPADSSRSQLTFNVRTLILWTTVIALGLGFVQFGRAQWEWTPSVFDWELFNAMPIIGLYNAGLALLCLWALAIGSWLWRVAKVTIAVVLIGVSAHPLEELVDLATGIQVYGSGDAFAQAAVQSVFLASSIAVVIVSRWLVTRRQETSH